MRAWNDISSGVNNMPTGVNDAVNEAVSSCVNKGLIAAETGTSRTTETGTSRTAETGTSRTAIDTPQSDENNQVSGRFQ